uniref:Pancreatic trypsin inhibitor n=1 Tax=Rhipicephalus appendiculatus TaxID=34631 RepID=A0A131YKH9_RHIAP
MRSYTLYCRNIMKIPLYLQCFPLFGLNTATIISQYMMLLNPITYSSAYDQRCLSGPLNAVNYGSCDQPTWRFNAISNKCERTCDRNGSFASKDECDGYCRSTAVCKAPRPLSSCLRGPIHTVFYYDPRRKKCVRGRQCTYLGNNFPTMEECQEKCTKSRQFQLIRNRCRVYPDHGRYCLLPNRHGSARFYYDPYHGRCYGFWYYGCGGNRNNFATIQHCLQRCARRGKVPAVDDVEAGTGVVFFK